MCNHTDLQTHDGSAEIFIANNYFFAAVHEAREVL